MGFLAEQPRSGYDLKTRCFEEQAGAFWTADQAQIYRTLDRLQAARMVTSVRKRRAGKPDRRVYLLTDAGATALAAWLASESPLAPPRDAFLVQVFFSAELSDQELVANLSARRRAHQSRLEELRCEVISHAQHVVLPQRVRLLRDAAFDGAMARERASIDWIDDTIEAIEGGKLPALAHGASSCAAAPPQAGSI